MPAEAFKPAQRGERKTLWRLYTSIFFCLGISAALITFTVHPVPIARTDQWTDGLHTVYMTVVTIVIGLLHKFIHDAIRDQWLHRLDVDLARHPNEEALKSLNQSWRADLGLLRPIERISTPSAWPRLTCYLVLGLVVTSVLAVVTPFLGESSFTFKTNIPQGAGSICGDYDSSANRSDWYTWNTPNGPYWAPVSYPACASRGVLAAMTLVNPNNRQLYAYADDGVMIDPSAIGAPQALYSSQLTGAPDATTGLTGLLQSLGSYGDSLLRLSQCAPVMKANPAHCRILGQVNLEKHLVNVTSGNCSQWNPVTMNAFTDNTMASGFCTGSSIGVGTVVIGATAFYAANLALAMGDMGWLSNNYNQSDMANVTYAVTCDINPAPVLAWRTLTVDLQQPFSATSPYRWNVSGGEACELGAGQELGEEYLAAAATGVWQILTENYGYDGYLGTLVGASVNYTGVATGYEYSPPKEATSSPEYFAFSDSKSNLEDHLGLATALGMSRIPLVDPKSKEIVPMIPITGIQTVSVYQVGTGQLYTLVYAIPSLVVAVFAIRLAFGKSDMSPTRKSSDLRDLLDLGREYSYSRV